METSAPSMCVDSLEALPPPSKGVRRSLADFWGYLGKRLMVDAVISLCPRPNHCDGRVPENIMNAFWNHKKRLNQAENGCLRGEMMKGDWQFTEGLTWVDCGQELWVKAWKYYTTVTTSYKSGEWKADFFFDLQIRLCMQCARRKKPPRLWFQPMFSLARDLVFTLRHISNWNHVLVLVTGDISLNTVLAL